MRSFAFTPAESVGQAVSAQGGDGDAAYIAGGTTLIDLVKLDVMRPARMVGVNRLPLNDVERLDDGRLRVGALVTNTELAHHPLVTAHFPLLSQAILAGASTQLRNMATTGGNIMQRTRCPYFRDAAAACNKREPGSGCDALDGINRMHAILGTSEHCIAAHPSDMCVALAALGATLTLVGPHGAREIAFGDFHRLPEDRPDREHEIEPGELITHVTLDSPVEGAGAHYLKLRDRASYEFALASAGAMIAVEKGVIREARLALGGVGTRPWHAQEAEQALRGQPPETVNFEKAAGIALRDASARQHNAFKIPLARQAIVRALEKATQAATDS
ncbi:xanthine dehydrogenase YagS FAD-binding subunit [Modicisalibacter ilicicola DSM 19980]|uniref:Xanthine dehydrogenase YagS FAD-binding subunit n=1 Tax=Modicisalibacter ilicicola DSM 19980 TaxID=1121942 RepID=A0A1M5EGC2_9GAMM|nr:xanthine dehydrogenase family protein subunit M [Halomonas ilicicola]SHF78227.1 xanthine dehydrogenase YagS FAD-binding subunit [Halomonas ilicicola DSM 19980]